MSSFNYATTHSTTTTPPSVDILKLMQWAVNSANPANATSQTFGVQRSSVNSLTGRVVRPTPAAPQFASRQQPTQPSQSSSNPANLQRLAAPATSSFNASEWLPNQQQLVDFYQRSAAIQPRLPLPAASILAPITQQFKQLLGDTQ